MRKTLLLLFTAFATLVTNAQTKVEINGIWYKLTTKDKIAKVTYEGDEPYVGGWYSGAITIPATVTHNGVSYSVTSIGEWAFKDCSSLTAINIPESVTSIGMGAFYGCSSLTAINIPESVTRIESSAFDGCSSLTAINIPEDVTSIEIYTFYGCSSLIAINIPESVTSIGVETFYGCSSLTAITCHAVTPPTIGNSYTFYNVDKTIPVYVPAGSVEAYNAAAYWSEFTNIVPLLEEAGIKELTSDNSQLTIYDLHGHRVTHLTKGGIYIVNGKKVVIK